MNIEKSILLTVHEYCFSSTSNVLQAVPHNAYVSQEKKNFLTKIQTEVLHVMK